MNCCSLRWPWRCRGPASGKQRERYRAWGLRDRHTCFLRALPAGRAPAANAAGRDLLSSREVGTQRTWLGTSRPGCREELCTEDPAAGLARGAGGTLPPPSRSRPRRRRARALEKRAVSWRPGAGVRDRAPGARAAAPAPAVSLLPPATCRAAGRGGGRRAQVRVHRPGDTWAFGAERQRKKKAAAGTEPPPPSRVPSSGLALSSTGVVNFRTCHLFHLPMLRLGSFFSGLCPGSAFAQLCLAVGTPAGPPRWPWPPAARLPPSQHPARPPLAASCSRRTGSVFRKRDRWKALVRPRWRSYLALPRREACRRLCLLTGSWWVPRLRLVVVGYGALCVCLQQFLGSEGL